jgi:hypothetical protein
MHAAAAMLHHATEAAEAADIDTVHVVRCACMAAAMLLLLHAACCCWRSRAALLLFLRPVHVLVDPIQPFVLVQKSPVRKYRPFTFVRTKGTVLVASCRLLMLLLPKPLHMPLRTACCMRRMLLRPAASSDVTGTGTSTGTAVQGSTIPLLPQRA